MTDRATWGDVADLVALVDVRRQADGRWLGEARPGGRRSVVEASQLLGQAVVAAVRHTGGRRVVHAAMTFPRAADAATAVPIELEPVTEGRTFSTLQARATQDRRTCATGTLLLDAGAPALVAHQVAAPPVAGPDAAVPYDMGVVGRELRIVDAAYTGDPDAPLGPPELDAWVRLHGVPDDPALHAGLLTQFTGHLSIAAALRPHAGIGQDQAHRTVSTAVNAISLALHAEPRVEDWLLYHHETTYAGDGMTHTVARVHTEAGVLVASFTVDAMVRAMPGSVAADPGSAL